ncbi:MAG TPA: UDP-glucuronic acid decarboxylase family protein [Clostridia bacterium]|nr:UDP-glucuronic acid decarboxylase family protein [Clostridia bacterium]
MGRVVVTGGAGFLGSHLCERLLARGDEVIAVDSLITGRRENVEHLLGTGGFILREADITQPWDVEGAVDGVMNFASPASPIDYARLPMETLLTGTVGTLNALDLARRKSARFMQASTSEIYGDPLVHPQTEDYWGNVNTIGPRAIYDEAKRVSETFATAFQRRHGFDVRIVRIFNTYGPRMRRNDGRAVPAFLTQALAGQPLTVFGDGSQTRSLCYVDDLITGILQLWDSEYALPMNMGNPEEVTMLQLAELVRSITGSTSDIEFLPLPQDDPSRRRPDIARARDILGWAPTIDLRVGLTMTAAWWRDTAEV